MAITEKNAYDGVSHEVTGVTTDNYVAALTVPCLGYGKKTIILDNTDTTDALIFKIDGYAHSGGIVIPLVVDVTLTKDDKYIFETTKGLGVLILSVKSAVASTPANYAIDYNLEKK